MSVINSWNGDEPPRRSKESRHSAQVEFLCRTDRKVDIFWLNYKGQKIKYATLTKGKKVSFSTYVSHPWVFRDADTFDVLVANNRHPFWYPTPWIGEEEPPVTIDLPVYSLKEICLQFLRKHMKDDDIRRQEMPRDLIQDALAQEDRSHGMVFFYSPLIE